MRKLRLFLRGRLFLCALIALCILAAGVLLSVWLPRALAPIAALERLFSLCVALAVALDKTPEEYRISKLALIVMLPWTGAVICLLFRTHARPAANFEGGMSTGETHGAAALAAKLCNLAPCAAKSADYFSVGREMYERLLPDLQGAKKYIWLEYYILSEGVFWGDVLAVLEQKVKCGVDVRLICDAFGCSLTLPPDYLNTLAARGIKTYSFRPVRFPSRAAGRRDHRKIAVIDGEIAYTGGINLADEYIGERIRFGHWKDTAIRVTGSCAGRFSELFARTWNAGNPSDMVCPSTAKGGTMSCAVVADSSDETEVRAGQALLLHLISGARKRLYLNTPYLAPDSALLHALKCAARAGTDVRLMIPHIPDKRIPFLLTRSYARELEQAGVRVREYTAGFLHAKSVVSDENAFVCSYNLDFRSLYLQAECGIVLASRPVADTLAADFLTAWNTGTPLPRAGRAKRGATRLLRLIAPLL